MYKTHKTKQKGYKKSSKIRQNVLKAPAFAQKTNNNTMIKMNVNSLIISLDILCFLI